MMYTVCINYWYFLSFAEIATMNTDKSDDSTYAYDHENPKNVCIHKYSLITSSWRTVYDFMHILFR